MTGVLPAAAATWETVDDGVMGGRSSSHMHGSDGGLRFEGTVSLANGGGFASVRAPLGVRLGDARGLALEVRGDGRRYQLRLRADGESRSIAWRCIFATSADWQTVTLAFSDFEPVFRGRRVADAPCLDPRQMQLIGFMTADKAPGPFRLEIRCCRPV
ncbi:MAG: CIA30 family protein [Pseudomonadales bacterium]